jgi:hypothetical protein
MTCLTNAQVQAVADGEATPVEREHAAACAGCGAKVEERRTQMSALTASFAAVEFPASSRQRIDAALAAGSPRSGATRLRPPAPQRSWRHAAWGSAALVAATLIAVLFIAPMVKQDRGAVSAAEVLAASADRLAQPVTGVELLEYELVLDGVPKELMDNNQDGTYRVRQAIDHSVPGRFRYSSYAPDGRPFSSIAQDPATGRRVMMFHTGGQAFRFDLTVPVNVGPSIVEMERLHLEATIAMMRAGGDQHLEEIETPDGRQYRIEVPQLKTPLVNPIWDLSEARVMIDARDYRVTELAVKGRFLKQPYSVSYRLLSRTTVTNVEPGTFEVPPVDGEIRIEGKGGAIPAHDAMTLALAELTKLKQAHR